MLVVEHVLYFMYCASTVTTIGSLARDFHIGFDPDYAKYRSFAPDDRIV